VKQSIPIQLDGKYHSRCYYACTIKFYTISLAYKVTAQTCEAPYSQLLSHRWLS